MVENKIEIFKNEEFGEIRTVIIDEEPWFCGKDVCAMFGDKNHSRSLGRIDDVDKCNIDIKDSMGRDQSAIFVNESGLYALLFSMQPQKANNDGVSDAYPIEVQERINKLHEFKRWITHDVIPSIRKHGAYMTEDTIKKVLTTPDFIIQLATELKEEQERNKALSAENQIMKPKAEYFDNLVDRNLLTNFRDTAKEFHRKQNEFINFLLDSGYVYRDQKGKLLPYAQFVDKGLFEIKEFSNKQAKGTQTLITPKGRETFRLLLCA